MLRAHIRRGTLLRTATQMPPVKHVDGLVEDEPGVGVFRKLTDEEFINTELMQWVRNSGQLMRWMKWVLKYTGLIVFEKSSGKWVGNTGWEKEYPGPPNSKNRGNYGRPKNEELRKGMLWRVREAPIGAKALCDWAQDEYLVSKSSAYRVLSELKKAKQITKDGNKWTLAPTVDSTLPSVPQTG